MLAHSDSLESQSEKPNQTSKTSAVSKLIQNQMLALAQVSNWKKSQHQMGRYK